MDIDPQRPEALRLRAEHAGSATEGAKGGRVYLIIVKATNSAGKVGVGSCAAVVAHSSSQDARDRVADRAIAAEAFADQNGGMPPPGFDKVGGGPVQGHGLKKVRPSSCGKLRLRGISEASETALRTGCPSRRPARDRRAAHTKGVRGSTE